MSKPEIRTPPLMPAACLLALAIPIATPAQSSEDERPVPKIDEIVVVAHKDARPISDIAANVTVLSRADIQDSLSTSFDDVFRYVPGIDQESAGTRFGSEGINIRGIGGNRVAMLVDGVPLSDQFDVGSFSNATRDFVNAGFVERVEVLHGPASALYGSSAIGGVVAVRTPDPADFLASRSIGGAASAAWQGADSSSHGSGIFAAGSQDFGVLLGGSLRDGEQLDSAAVEEPLDFRDYRRRSAIAKLVANDNWDNTWRLSLLRQHSSVSSDLNSMLGSGRFRSTTALQGDDDYRMNLAALSYEFGSGEGWVDAGLVRAYYQQTGVEQSTLDERAAARRPVSIDRYFEFNQDVRGIEINLQKAFATGRIDHRAGFGVEYRRRDTVEYRDGLEHDLETGQTSKVLLGEVFPLRDFPPSETDEWGAYLEDVMSVGDWSLIAAVRGDRYDMQPLPDAMYAEDYPFAAPVSVSASDLSPKLGVIYSFSDAGEIYAQYSHGFRAPPYEDANIGLEIPLFNYRAVPNPDLKSESSDGVDVGVRWRGEYSDLQFGVFHTRYSDFIESKRRIGVDPSSGRVLFQSQNIGSAEIRGVEGSGQLDLGRVAQGLALDGSFYIARGENRDSGEYLNSVGPAQLVAGLSWSAPSDRTSARLQSTFTERWSRVDETGGEQYQPPGYAVFDLFVTQRLGKATSLRLGLLNLADKTYWRWSDVQGLSPDDPVLPFLARPGRSVSASVTFDWN